MDIRPIRTEADYRAALEEAKRLWDAEPGTYELQVGASSRDLRARAGFMLGGGGE